MNFERTGLMGLMDKAESQLVKLVPISIVSLVLRVAIAVPFFKSGLTKWDGFLQLSDTPPLLFAEEFNFLTVVFFSSVRADFFYF